jgi:hypothetical protein
LLSASVDPKRENPDADIVFEALHGIQQEKMEKRLKPKEKNKKGSTATKIVKF